MNSSVASDVIDRILLVLKWPAAVLAIAALPGAAIALGALAARMALKPSLIMFLAGSAGYAVLWFRKFRYIPQSSLPTLQQELTRAIFALATFHRVSGGFRGLVLRSGRVSLVGRGNWLISVSPYFCPTLSLVLIFFFAVVPAPTFGLDRVLIGASFAHHLITLPRGIRGGQSDIEEAGRLFCLLLLPTASLIAAGVVLSFCHTGVLGLWGFLAAIFHRSIGLAHGVWSLF